MPIQHPQFFPFLPTFFRKASHFPYLLSQLIDSTLYVSKVHVFYIPNDGDHKTLGRSKVHDQQIHRSDTQITVIGQEPGLSPAEFLTSPQPTAGGWQSCLTPWQPAGKPGKTCTKGRHRKRDIFFAFVSPSHEINQACLDPAPCPYKQVRHWAEFSCHLFLGEKSRVPLCWTSPRLWEQ